MKNNWLKYLVLLGMFISGNVFCMPRPSSQAQSKMQKAAAKSARDALKAKAASEKQIIKSKVQTQSTEWPPKSGSVREELEEAFMTDKELRYKKEYPDRCYIYQEGTDNGVGIKKDFLIKNSGLARNMIEKNKGVMPAQIALPFSIDIIITTFNVIEDQAYALKLDLNTWKKVMEVEKYLLISKEIIGETVRYCPVPLSLEELITYFNVIPAEPIFSRIMDFVKDICLAIAYQGQIDENSIASDEYIKDITLLFKNYKGETIAIRSGKNSYFIPNYKLLNNMNKQDEFFFKENSKLPFGLENAHEFYEIWINPALRSQVTYGIMVKYAQQQMKNFYQNNRLVDFIDYCVKKVQESYNAIPWYRKIFWYLSGKK